jgi:ATP-dependent protease ClpP protease subunit
MPANVLPFTPPLSSSPWLSVRAEAGGKGVIDIRGEIGLPKEYEEYGMEASGTVSEFTQAVKDLGNVSEIEMNIYSGGGSVFVALAMHNILARHPARVVANIDGFAGSAATILMLAADEIRMPENAYLMIHNASMFAWGDHRDMVKAAEDLRKWSRDIANLYTSRIEDNTGAARDSVLADIIAKMDAETWLTGAEAKALGLVETMTGRVELAACVGSPITAPVRASLHRDRVPEPLHALLFDSAAPAMSIPALSPADVAAAISAPVAVTADAPAPVVAVTPAVEAPVAVVAEPAADPAAVVAPVVEETPTEPVAPVAVTPEAPVAPAAAEPAALTLDAIRNVVADAVNPLAERLASAEAALANEQQLRAAGVPQNAWGNQQPAEIPTGDVPAGPDMSKLSPAEMITAGRIKNFPVAAK